MEEEDPRLLWFLTACQGTEISFYSGICLVIIINISFFQLNTASQDGSTQTQGTQQSNRYQRLVKRMTRFWVNTGPEKTATLVQAVLVKMGYTVRAHCKGVVSREIISSYEMKIAGSN